jgi:hypothetical protein
MSTVEFYITAWLFIVLAACAFNCGMLVGIWVSNFFKRKESQ